mgnify:CR=1 FL=1|tara:strand:- start:116474 stop:116761 length:288 start_codon:yes stop_codon:yes gene_type:complete
MIERIPNPVTASLVALTLAACGPRMLRPRQVCEQRTYDKITTQTKIEEIAEEICTPLYQVGSVEYLECFEREIVRVSSSTAHSYSSEDDCRTVYE